jgi:hypothetical protein
MSLSRLACLGLLALGACATPSRSAAPAAEDTYGRVPENPVRVGNGPPGERAYLTALRGPGGQLVVSRRLGSCCIFETPNGFDGRGLLDIYEVTYEGLDEPVRLYLDMYDAGEVRAPRGFVLEGAGGSGVRPATQEVIEL